MNKQRIKLPHNLLVWVEVDLESGEVTEVSAVDFVENYERNGEVAFVHLDDVAEGSDDIATAVQVKLAEEIAGSVTWPKLKVEESYRHDPA